MATLAAALTQACVREIWQHTEGGEMPPGALTAGIDEMLETITSHGIAG